LLVIHSNNQWIVSRRHEHFTNLYRSLAQQFANSSNDIPPFSIQKLRNNSPFTISKHEAKIQAWLDQILSIPNFNNDKLIQEFLAPAADTPTNVSDNDRCQCEGFLYKLVGRDAWKFVYWKKPTWHAFKYGSILKYKNKGDKHPAGIAYTIKSWTTKLSQKDTEHCSLANQPIANPNNNTDAEDVSKNVVFPFILYMQEKSKSDYHRKLVFATSTENDRKMWISTFESYFQMGTNSSDNKAKDEDDSFEELEDIHKAQPKKKK